MIHFRGANRTGLQPIYISHGSPITGIACKVDTLRPVASQDRSAHGDRVERTKDSLHHREIGSCSLLTLVSAWMGLQYYEALGNACGASPKLYMMSKHVSYIYV